MKATNPQPDENRMAGQSVATAGAGEGGEVPPGSQAYKYTANGRVR
jgi:hypothetical protein